MYYKMSVELLIGRFFCYVVPSLPAASAYGRKEKKKSVEHQLP